MASANPRPYSRPVLERTLNLRTEQAQRIMAREGDRVLRALHAIAVVFRVTLPSDAADALEKEALQWMEEGAEALATEIARVSALRESEGITLVPCYSHPGEIPVRVLCPPAHDFLAMIEGLDELIVLIDSLWLSGLLTNRHRSEAAYQWQQRILRIARRVAALEGAVRAGQRGVAEGPVAPPELQPVLEPVVEAAVSPTA
jgi:hypothetical protein